MRRQRAGGYCLAVMILAGFAGARTKEPVVSSTGNGKTTSESADSAARRGKSLVRFVNALLDQSLDLTTQDRATFIDVGFKAVTPYTEIGKARIRVIQATPGLSDVDVALSGQKDLVFDNIRYGTEAGYKDVTPATATLEFRMGDPPHVTVPLRLKTMTLAPGRAYTLVIVGAPPRGIQTIAFNDAVRR